jgi:glycosyltransferase involved in cell wall biosynthesis
MPPSAKPLVSVLTPFHNTERYLAGAIESVLAQTYSNFEYILIDNCSTDRSGEIAKSYAARDSRIRFMRRDELVPQLRNYNLALRTISPESRYVKIVQADDAAFPRCLEEMVAVAEAHPTVGVVSSYRKVGNGVGPSGLPRERVFLTGREAGRLNLIEELFLFGSQTTVMMRADIVRAKDPFYHENRYFADSDVVYEIVAEHDFAFVHQVLTFSRVDKESIGGGFKRFGALMLDRLIRLKLYGASFLTPEEHDRYLTEHRAAYRRFFAEAWLRRREQAFWDFHRKGLAIAGEDIDPSRFPKDVLPVLVRYAIEAPQIVTRHLFGKIGTTDLDC